MSAAAGSAPICPRIIWTNGVAVMLNVQPWRAIRCRAARGSQTSIRSMPAPSMSGAVTPIARPVACVTGEGMNMTSSGLMDMTWPPRALTVNVTVLSVCRQPFGRDSVPEV